MPRIRAGQRLAVLGLVGVLGLLGVTACTNTQASVNRRPHTGTATASTVGSAQQVSLDVGDDFRFHPSTFVVHRGLVRVVLKHTGTGAPHNFQVVGFPAGFVPQTNEGQTRSATFTAPTPGTYHFVCTFHERQGMTGTMIVKG